MTSGVVFSFCTTGWGELLLNAAEFPAAQSIHYANDLRYLFQKKLENEITLLGLPVKPKIPLFWSRSKATILDVAPIAQQNGDILDGSFCFGYGGDDDSFSAINSRSEYDKKNPLPNAFINKYEPMTLGNFAVGIEKPSSGLFIHPPPEWAVAGLAEVSSAKQSSVLLWLGVRYEYAALSSWLLDTIEELEPINQYKQNSHKAGYAYGTTFSQHFAGDKYNLSADEELQLRKEMGYPVKGKPIREFILYQCICEIFGPQNVIRRYRGREIGGLELDIWIPIKKLAIEYQGAQHYQRINHWQTEAAFLAQKARDKTKLKICQALGIQLLYFNRKDALDRDSVIRHLRQFRAI